MNGIQTVSIITVLVLVLVSAFFSTSETALSSITKFALHRIRKNKNKADRILTKILSDQRRMITTLLVGNNVVNIWASSIATALGISFLGTDGIGVTTLVMTLLLLVFAELTPKTIAANDPEKFARLLAPAVARSETLLFPVVSFFSGINSVFLFLFSRLLPEQEHRLTTDEIKTLISLGKKDGALETGEHDLLHRAFNFTGLKLREIMTPRTAITAVNAKAGMAEVKSLFCTHQFSRMPVYEDSIDHICGMVIYKDILFNSGPASYVTLGDIMQPVFFAPETQTAFELLQVLEKKGQSMAIVVDEHGGTAGLVTVDDALAAVFGGIRDEYDEGTLEPIEQVEIIGENRIRIPGDLRLDDLSALLKTPLQSSYFETVGGFVL
jgi:putative hemolysin